MANYLNAGILGDGAGVANRRAFRAIPTEYIDTPAYNAKYFEAYPTVWACAYAFSKMLASEADQVAGVPPRAERARAAETATEEWACLFLLYFFGDLHIVSYDRAKLEQEYDRDLWIALSGTYPESGEQAVTKIRLLETDAGTVVGGYYPETVFFPSRGRTTWARDQRLAAYLDGTRLSWEKCSALLLRGEREQRDFQEHLELVARHWLPSKVFQDRLRDFSSRHFFDRVDPSGTLPQDVEDAQRGGEVEPTEFLKKYPLQKPNQRGGTTYYLVEKMRDKTDWMTVSTAAGWPAPHQYVESGNNQISVPYRGRQIVCHLSDNDDIVYLHKFFLADSPHWCKIPKAAEAHTARIKSLHKIELRDPALTDQDLAVCLAPLASGFLEQFPEILNNLDQIRTTIDWQGMVEWSFPVMGKEVRWRTRPTLSRALSATSLSMWPPRVSRQWHLYAAYGVGGKKKDRGLWNLVDEYGEIGKLIEIDDEEYFSVLQRSDGKANRPRTLLLRDGEGEGRERGVLFLSEFQEETTSGDGTATLAVDFGTSNTCLAYNDGESKVLNFKLTPETLWGKRPALENPGFVPFEWGGQKGFFPTILLSRRSDPALGDELHPDQVKLEHLFKVDIPGLHKEMEERLSEGYFDRVWKLHANPKWETARTRPWRTLFLELTLLYAHAELFFNRGVKLDKYVFTFPLAFSKPEQDNYHEKAQAALRKIREYCYGTTPATDHFDYEHRIDESTAIAESVGAAANAATMDVFIDIGGGTADIAIRYNGRYLVLDSLKVAGNTFFRFADRNFRDEVYGAAEFKQHLARLLQGRDDGSEFRLKNNDKEFSLGVRYSVAINALDDAKFREREMAIMDKTKKGNRSYQIYRTRLLFRHVMTYALLQACAAVVEQKAKLSSGVKLVLGGNAWGLLMFAGIPRSAKHLTTEAEQILKQLKRDLLPTLCEEGRPYLENEKLRIASLELLNESNLSKAKTNVALGALKASPNRRNGDQRTPYAGITVSNLKLNKFEPKTLRWYDRWGFDEFIEKFGFMDRINEATFEPPEDLEKPIDGILSVFTRVGNTSTNEEDNMPPDIWVSMNGKLSESVNNLQGQQLDQTPINYFISEVLYPHDAPRDFLDDLAAKNGQLRPNSDEE